MTYRKNIQDTNLFPKIIKHQINPFIQVRYTTHLVWDSTTWKLVIQWHGNARVSHMDLFDFETQRIGT